MISLLPTVYECCVTTTILEFKKAKKNVSTHKEYRKGHVFIFLGLSSRWFSQTILVKSITSTYYRTSTTSLLLYQYKQAIKIFIHIAKCLFLKDSLRHWWRHSTGGKCCFLRNHACKKKKPRNMCLWTMEKFLNKFDNKTK